MAAVATVVLVTQPRTKGGKGGYDQAEDIDAVKHFERGSAHRVTMVWWALAFGVMRCQDRRTTL